MKMACVEDIPPLKVDSEMEEGEIVDDLSDISSEEEFLLRQRLQVLENYNNVLERKKAKRSSTEPGTKHRKEDALLNDLSEISANELEDYYSQVPHKPLKVPKHQKTHHRQKRRKLEPIVNSLKTKDYKKKNHHSKKKLAVKVISESSEESEDEYRNRRRKLADAVVVNKYTNKIDKTSLSERLQKMLCRDDPEPMKELLTERIISTPVENKVEQSIELSPISSLNADDNNTLESEAQVSKQEKVNSCELIDLCTDEDSTPITTDRNQDTVDSVSKINENEDVNKTSEKQKLSDKDSDDDLELLRQHALETKNIKAKVVDTQSENKILSEDEDSDTEELRLICLKSALLKKAIERKQKQKLKKRLSQSSNLANDFLNSDNNTDIESVDMDIGSDADEKNKETPDICVKTNDIEEHTIPEINALTKDILTKKIPDEEELEDDEDLLRAKLLTSLSKNLPNLVNPNIINSIGGIEDKRPVSPKMPQVKSIVPPVVVPEEKRFIITLGESDSEGEHEATKNLTKMHMKLSEQVDFQQRLDMFLKSTRMEVEKGKLPDVVQQPTLPKKNEKFVAKAVNHLPKSEQIEYRNLVKRMAELEKIKQARQSTIHLGNNISPQIKDTLKPRNTTTDAVKLSAINSLEEKIKTSRKHIAEESAKMLKLKEEATKLSQKYKIVATELRNIKTAIALNKKQTRSVQNCLNKIRLHHQNLLKSSISTSHSTINSNMLPFNKINQRLQKENNPANEELDKATKVKDNNRVIEEQKRNIVHKPTPVVGIDKNLVVVEHKDPAVTKPTKVFVNDTSLVREVHCNPVECNLTKIASNADNLAKQELKNVHRPITNAKENLVVVVRNHSVEKNQDVVQKPPLLIQHPRLSVELDVTSNKKIVKMPDDKTDGKNKNLLNLEKTERNKDLLENKRLSSNPVVEKGGGNEETEVYDRKANKNDDYKSPLDAFGSTTWEGDPNAILCPFEVGGDCKDGDCIYLHTQPRFT